MIRMFDEEGIPPGDLVDRNGGAPYTVAKIADVIAEEQAKYLVDQYSAYTCGCCGDMYLGVDGPFCECAEDHDHDHDEDEDADAEDYADWCADWHNGGEFENLDRPVQIAVCERMAALRREYYNLDSVFAHCEEAIEQIDATADDPFDVLAAAIAATAIQHCFGVVCTDYGVGMDEAWLDDLRNNSPAAVFDPDELKEWMEVF
jgi:hypothetical protein